MTSTRHDRGLLFLSSGIAFLLLYLPVLLVIVFSFNSATRGMIWEHFSFRWYREIWSDRALLSALWNTIRVVTIASTISLTLGVVCGYCVAVCGRRLFGLLIGCLFIPVLTPDIIMSLAQALAYNFFGVRKGILTIAVSQSTFGIAYVALFVAIRLRSLDFAQYVLAAQSLGASPLRTVRDHFLPLAAAPALAGVSIVAAMSAQDFVFAFFCGGTATTTLSVKIYGMVKFGLISSINVVYTILALGVLLLFLGSEAILTRKERHEVT